MVEQGWLTHLDRFHRDNPDAPKPLTTKRTRAREIAVIPEYEREWRKWDATFERWQQRRAGQGLPVITSPKQPPLFSSAIYHN